jgi:hypothetical protein
MIDGVVVFHNEDRNKCSEPMLIYCNPNAGYYETLALESEWVEFYTERGINVCLWNYRGYSHSQGTPTPQALTIINRICVQMP